MAKMIKCDCSSLKETEINSYKLFEELKMYFNKKVEENVFQDVAVKRPLQIIGDNGECITQWYPTKWYQCNECDTIWAFEYPDFPAKGHIYKLNSSGIPVEESIFYFENRRKET